MLRPIKRVPVERLCKIVRIGSGMENWELRNVQFHLLNCGKVLNIQYMFIYLLIFSGVRIS